MKADRKAADKMPQAWARLRNNDEK